MAKINLGRVKPDIANNLTTTTAGSALDAAQGPVLDEKISKLNTNLGKVYTVERSGVTLNTGVEYSFTSLTLPAGTYVVTGHIAMMVNANHFVAIAGDVTYGRVQFNGLSYYQNVNAIVELTATTTIKLNLYQASGANVTGVGATLTAVKFK